MEDVVDMAGVRVAKVTMMVTEQSDQRISAEIEAMDR